MQLISIKNTAVMDGEGPWPDIEGKVIVAGTSLEIALIERGMQSGEPSLAIRFCSEEGPPMVFECGLAHLETTVKGLLAAHQGNVERGDG